LPKSIFKSLNSTLESFITVSVNKLHSFFLHVNLHVKPNIINIAIYKYVENDMRNLVLTRIDLGYTQKQLGELAGITQPTISLVEQGKRYPQANTRHKIEKVVGAIDWISTKLHGGKRIESDINESPENRIIREIELFTADDPVNGFEFLEIYVQRKLFTVRFMVKVYKELDGQEQQFTGEEQQLLIDIANSDPIYKQYQGVTK